MLDNYVGNELALNYKYYKTEKKNMTLILCTIYLLTISEFPAPYCFKTFSWKLPIAPSAHSAKDISITPEIESFK